MAGNAFDNHLAETNEAYRRGDAGIWLTVELHQLRTKESEEEIARREGEVNEAVRDLFDLPDAR